MKRFLAKMAMRRILALVGAALILGGLAGGLTGAFAFDSQVTAPGTEGEQAMTSAEAIDVARHCACAAGGWFTGDVFYDEASGTWWLRLDVKKDGSSLACVIDVETREVQITGEMPAADEIDWEQVGVPLVSCVPPKLPDGDGTSELPKDYPAEVVAVGNTVEVFLESNATTGYRWTAEFDDGLLELVDQRYEVSSNLVGAGGQEVFVFKALAAGRAGVEFNYARPWEAEVLKTETRTFDILPSLDRDMFPKPVEGVPTP